MHEKAELIIKNKIFIKINNNNNTIIFIAVVSWLNLDKEVNNQPINI